MSLLKLAYRNLRAFPERFWPMAIAVFLLVFFMLNTFMGIHELRGLRQQSLRELAVHQTRVLVIPRFAESTGLRQSFQTLNALAGKIKAIEGVAGADQLSQFAVGELEGRRVYFTAVVPGWLQAMSEQAGNTAGLLFPERLMVDATAVAGSALAQIAADGTLVIAGFRFSLAGAMEESNTSADWTLYMSPQTAALFQKHIEEIGQAARFAKADEQSVLVTVDSRADPLEVSNRILKEVKNVYLFDGATFFREESGGLEAVERSSGILLALVPGTLTLGMGVLFGVTAFGRRREISVLRALGAKSALVLRLLLLENLIVGLFGGALALLLFGLYLFFGNKGAGLEAGWVLSGLGMGLAGAHFATGIPSFILSRREPASYMRG